MQAKPDIVKPAPVGIEVLASPSLSREELDAMAAVEEACYSPATRYSRTTIQRYLGWEGSLLVRARSGQILAGFQIGNIVSGHLITLDVRPEFRRRGIGSEILRTTLDEMRNRGLPYAQCEIAAHNKASIILHQRFGFQIVGGIPEYYEDGSDALLMLLVFPEAPRTGPR
jgi:ribosomal-protein-alanine N-acetyltransferase